MSDPLAALLFIVSLASPLVVAGLLTVASVRRSRARNERRAAREQVGRL